MANSSTVEQCATDRRVESAGTPMFLHGDINIWIREARSLPNMDLTSERMRKCFTIFGILGSCSPCGFQKENRSMSTGRLSRKHSTITSDPYVSICLRGATVAQTRVIFNCENPSWDEHFSVPVAHPVINVEFQVKDNDVLGAQLIGIVGISAEKILSGDDIDGWFPISGPYETNSKGSPELHLCVKFQPVEDNTMYKYGVSHGPEYLGVPNTYFPLRKGGNVTLYQDAHVTKNMLPEIPLDDGKKFQQHQCWEDLCHAMMEAHNLIYITGWSVYHKIKLIREPTRPLPAAGELTLGELLKYKSEEGLRVIVLVWDDKTSHDKFLFKTDGVMQTHDEETRKFFKHSGVHCVLCPRYASSKLSIFKQQVVGTLFTHHQKCVLLDTQATGNSRKITAFIGGLDLCDGRYDTPEHRLFTDLDTIFRNDVHNPTFSSVSGGPREPWHDLHCRIDGPAAYDIMTNFEQRWEKATKWRNIRLRQLTHWNENTLLKIEQLSFILTPKSGPGGDQVVRVTTEDDEDNWHVQVFRSIDSGSVKGFPKNSKEAEAQSLVCGKNLKVDRSIHTAYVNAIRSAQHFIYIENQYFIGSSFYWPSYKHAGADNLIPMELALKIANKIRVNERFSVYILIPLWPEGFPSSNAVQEILYWQGQTMSMMYKIVAEALEKAGLTDVYHPEDYLNFYCLGKREILSAESIISHADITCEGRSVRPSQKYDRFMVYVHGKGMIVDDEYILMGSANINQRSLDGSRDTEIAMGSYQPNYTWANKKNPPRGQVYGYRMSLWAEHLGKLEKSYENPQSRECVNQVNKIAKSNWETFVGQENRELTGHLMKYPIKVNRSGKVSALPGHESFPDVGGKVLGAPNNLPDVLTT